MIHSNKQQDKIEEIKERDRIRTHLTYCLPSGLTDSEWGVIINNVQSIISSTHKTGYEQGRKDRDVEVTDLKEALLCMYTQYCQDGHLFMTAGEQASNVLEQYNYAHFDDAGRLINLINSNGENKKDK